MAEGSIATIKRAIHREKELFQIQIAMQGRKIANGLGRSSPMSENHDIQKPGYNWRKHGFVPLWQLLIQS